MKRFDREHRKGDGLPRVQRTSGMPEPAWGRKHAAVRTLAIAANTATVSALLLLFSAGPGGFAAQTGCTMIAAYLAGLVLSLVGLVLLAQLIRGGRKPGWGLAVLVLLPFLITAVLGLIMISGA